jgi:hypothetical protein
VRTRGPNRTSRGAPDYGGVPDGPFEREPAPMLGQFLVEVEPEPEPEPEPWPDHAFEDPEPALPAREFDDGVVVDELDVEEFDVELGPMFPEFPVVADVVAALATSAPPATRPDVSAPTANTLRRRICIGCPFSLGTGPLEPVVIGCAPDLSAPSEGRGWVRGVVRRIDDDSQQQSTALQR